RDRRAGPTRRSRSRSPAARARGPATARAGDAHSHRQNARVPLAHADPVVGPEQDRTERRREAPPADARAYADSVVAVVELGFHDDRPGLDLAEVGERLIERCEALLVAAARVAHHEALAHRVIAQLAAQRDGDDACAEPESPLAIDSRIEVEGERLPVAERAADGRAVRV